MKPTSGKRRISNNTALPVNQAQHQQLNINQQEKKISSIKTLENLRKSSSKEAEVNQVINVEDFERNNSKKLTICLICFFASLTCLSPYLSLHSTQRVGLLLFESDLIQLRSSLISVIILAVVLVILYVIHLLLSSLHRKRGENSNKSITRSLLFQRILRQLIGFAAIISAISYLSLTLIVPQIRQIQRMPLATFDCNANLITIENCHQQFSSSGPEQTLKEAIEVLYLNDLSGKRDRLINKFNCLKYNDKDLEKLQVPTRFLLHHCTLVCKPQRQQLHQFGDDLNQDQNWPSDLPTPKTTPHQSRLVPPYQHHEFNRNFGSTNGETDEIRSTTYYNSSQSAYEGQQSDMGEQDRQQVSLRVCFSGEFTGGSNYKQFCITNLAHSDHSHALTVGQLNAMLRRITPAESETSSSTKFDSLAEDHRQQQQQQYSISSAAQVVDQSTNYVNPIVQFESHFKNWPHLHEEPKLFDNMGKPIPVNDIVERNEFYRHQDSWCKFKPIPPLIVNNRPFNDIQCSLEHEYTMTTGSSIDSTTIRGNNEKIFLKKSKNQHESSGSGERCNIQCKVNILYQIHVADESSSSRSARESAKGTVTERVNLQHYYLPLKPCLIMSGSSSDDKSTTANYYLLFRSLGDSALLLVLMLLEIFLLLESIDTKQSPLESKKYRLSGLLLIVTLMPLIVGLLFDLTSQWSPYTSASRARKEQPGNQLISFLYDSIQTSLSDLFSQRSTLSNNKRIQKSPENRSNSTNQQLNLDQERSRSSLSHSSISNLFDNYLVPFFIYAVCMFLIAIHSLSLPLISPTTPLLRVSSIEELGMSKSLASSKQTSNIKNKKKTNNPTDKATTVEQIGMKKLASKKKKRRTTRMISFAAVVLFMGTQFNLSQIIQTQIIFDSFSNPSNQQVAAINADFTAFWFAIATHSSASFFVLCIVLVFSEETSAFFSRMSMFKMSLINNMDNEEESTRRSRLSYLKHLTFAIFIYSTRFILLTNIKPSSRFKWLLVFVVQVTELINFPIIWLATCARLHELLLISRRKDKIHEEERTRDVSSISAHIIGRSLLSFGYFVICRFIALTIHSLHTSIHLHSDNVDWFITSFYVPPTSDTQQVSASGQSLKDQPSVSSGQENSNINVSESSSTQKLPDSLFSPLPSERQTYLYASRLFLKYNSSVCLLIGLILLMILAYVKYQIWLQQKRTFELKGFARTTSGSDLRDRSSDSCIDERISFDLMQIHAANETMTRTIPPKVVVANTEKQTTKHRRKYGPRANILFHYNLDKQKTDSSDLSLSDADATKPRKETQKSNKEFNIPIDLEEEEEDKVVDKVEQEEKDPHRRHKKNPDNISLTYELKPEPPEPFRSPSSPEKQQPELVEHIVRHHRKRIQIVEEEEDEEIWQTQEDENQSGHKRDSYFEAKAKKKISFAPKATLIDNSYEEGSSAESSRQTIDRNVSSMMPKRASPEPSIGNDDSDYDDQDD